MAYLFTSKNQEILIDDEDVEFLSQFSWFLDKKGYARTNVGFGEHRTQILMHRLLMCPLPEEDVDHKNFCRSDNQKENLENLPLTVNRSLQRKIFSCGVYPRDGKFRAALPVSGKLTHLGTYKTFDLALLARVIAEIRHYGQPVQCLL